MSRTDPPDSGADIRRLRELFDAAADLESEGRREFLAELDAKDVPLRPRLQAMLEKSETTSPKLAGALNYSAAMAASNILVGKRLGPYSVTRLLGVGGMGAVYEGARADEQFEKRVAIKMVQGGPLTEETLARFRRERQILASLEHPNIATLYDGGVSPEGTPFLVMEYVDGVPITQWCDSRRMDVRSRLHLFGQVCAAVQYAHSKLVVHRDVKPGNILVTPDGAVKLLDFGIAKLIADESGETPLPVTRSDARAFTPEYASPEQIRGDSLGTATDTYSLGVVLYELLAGTRPQQVSLRPADSEHRGGDTTTSRKPSTVATREAAETRGLPDAGALRSELSGDLDAIVQMSLRPEPEQRYRTVEALAEDLQRYLSGLPVMARRGGTSYRLGKYVRRHAPALAAGLLILISLAAGMGTTRMEANRARLAQERAERVSGFLADLLRSVRSETGGRDVPVSELLDAASRRIPSELAAQPEVRQELETVLGQSYLSLGRFDESERHFRSALEISRRLNGAASHDAATLLSDLGVIELQRGDPARADSTFRQAIEMHRSLGAREDTLLASLYSNLGSAAHDQGDMKSAEKWHRQAVSLKSKLLGPRSDEVVASLSNLAVALGEQGRWAEAESLHRASLEMLKEHHRAPNREIADVENALATALDLQGKFQGADSMYRDAIAQRKILLGPGHPDLAFTMMNYAMMLFAEGRHHQAAEMAREILSYRGKLLPDSHSSIPAALQTLGRAEDKLGHAQGAEAALKESLELRRKYLPPGHWLVASSTGVLGEHYTATREWSRAEPLLREAERGLEKQFGEENSRTQVNVARLVAMYEAAGRPADAAIWRSRLVHK